MQSFHSVGGSSVDDAELRTAEATSKPYPASITKQSKETGLSRIQSKETGRSLYGASDPEMEERKTSVTKQRVPRTKSDVTESV